MQKFYVVSIKKNGVTMFRDCLLDEKALPVWNGKPEEVRDYILKNKPFPDSYRVYEGFGNTLMTVDEYLEKEDS